MRRKLIFPIFLLFAITGYAQANNGVKTTYKAIDGAIVGNNTGRYNNRPLHINNTNAFILTGDQPIARLVKDEFIYGTFMLAIERNGVAKWFQNCNQITSKFFVGKMDWEISDAAFPGLKIELNVVPMTLTTGMAIRTVVAGVKPGDKLIWAIGGGKRFKGEKLSWKLDISEPGLLEWGFVPDECKNNSFENKDKNFILNLTDANENQFSLAGSCSAETQKSIGNALEWTNPTKLNLSKESNELPLLNGVILLENGKSTYWTFEAFNQPLTPNFERINQNETAFEDGQKRIKTLSERVKVSTPDIYLNTLTPISVATIDAAWYAPVFVHGTMSWNRPFPGWRTLFGAIAYGWHDRVKTQAKYYTDSQVKVSDLKEAKADPLLLHTGQARDSRFYGVGHLSQDQDFYDMQTQFFDQIVEEYRWTNDPELIQFFRNALELHLLWMRECFDPDGDGVYESYINTWPTDSQWYNGGGTAEETSYAYRGHLAARDMAHNAGDSKSEKFHNEMLAKIKKGFFDKLWINRLGHSGAYREQGGHERLHENPWSYSIFLPIDAGLTTSMQAIESVYYSEWALQNDKLSSGGRMVWASNWVPGIWSVRERHQGDNYHLAQSYFQAGLPNEAWDIMRGTFMHSGYNELSPGAFDGGDCTNPFGRCVAAGLFGYTPDYPNGKVKIAPQFPTDWDSASIELPDVKIKYKRIASSIQFNAELKQVANLEILIPIQSSGVKNVTVNGKTTTWKLIQGVGRSVLQVAISTAKTANILVETVDHLPYYEPIFAEGNVGEELNVKLPNARILKVYDAQNVFCKPVIRNNQFSAKLKANKGYHTVFAEVLVGKAPQLRVIRVKVIDPVGNAREQARYLDVIPQNSTWENIDLSSYLNADVTTIYKQKYLSPRPNTVSVRLGSDGYSPWTFPYWGCVAPTIKTDSVKAMLDSKNILKTPQGVPFKWNTNTENVAFTSMWDNFPKKIEFPINTNGKAIYFLICGSTNVMQCQIANAVIRLEYADGQKDSLELIPPVNYWNLCPIKALASHVEQNSRTDYYAKTDRFCMPAKFPETVQLGENCRAMLLNLKLRSHVTLKKITLETLSQEVVVGLMGVSILK